MSDQMVANTVRTKADQALLAAWRRFLDFDQASTAQKLHHSKIRTAIIVLGFAASALAVAISTKDTNPIIGAISEPLRIALIFLPIISAGLLTYASEFTPSLTWLAYRVGAELTRREIYLYRMQAGDYHGKSPLDQQTLLLSQVEATNKRVNRFGVPDPYLQATITDVPTAIVGKTSNPGDDGFSPLTADEYITFRVVPQKDWYIRKSHADYQQTRRWRVYLIVVGIASSALAALNFAPFVAVTTALGAALTTYMGLKMFGRNFPVYHPVANNLEIEMDRWSILSAAQQADPAQISMMVKHVEDIFQSESDQWTQQAIQAQQSIEQSLAKSTGSSQSLSGLSQQPSTTTTNLVVSQPDAATTVVAVQQTQTVADGSSTPPDSSTGVTVVSGAAAASNGATGANGSQPAPVTVTVPASSDPSTSTVTSITVTSTMPAVPDSASDAATAPAITSAASSTDTSAAPASSPATTPTSPATLTVAVGTNSSTNGGSNGSVTSGNSDSSATSAPRHPADHGDGTAG